MILHYKTKYYFQYQTMAANKGTIDSDILDIILNKDIDPDENYLAYGAIKDFKNTPIYSTHKFNDFFSKLNNGNNALGLTMLNLNVRSLLKNINEMQLMLHELLCPFHIISLQETWLTQEANSFDQIKLKLEGYNFINIPRKNAVGGGVGYYLRSEIAYKRRIELCSTSDDLEMMTIEIINEKSKNIIISNIYRPPKGKLVPFKDSLSQVINQAECESKPIYLLGDFNLNLLDYATEPNVREFVNMMYGNMLLPAINKPTRITLKASTCIDNIFVKTNFQDKLHAGIIAVHISDHLPQFLIVESFSLPSIPKRVSIVKRHVTNEQISLMKDRLSNTSWNRVSQGHNIDEAYSAFIDEFSYLYEELFPMTKTVVKTKTLLNKWMNKKLVTMSRKKQRLYIRFVKHRTYASEVAYQKCKKEFEKEKQRTKKSYYIKQLERHQDDIKKSWSLVKEIIGCNKFKENLSPSHITVNGHNIFCKTQMANAFNSYFVNVGQDLAKVIPLSQKGFEEYVQQVPLEFNIGPITCYDVKYAIDYLKSHKSSGHDDISVDVIKQVSNELLLPLSYLFTLSVEKGVFPKALKVAKVIPSFKSDEQNELSNYRPISLLSVFSKILESIIHQRLYMYLEVNKLLFAAQFGFRKQCTTEFGILELVENVTRAMNHRQITIGVFLDLSKAFDTVDHSILLTKLSLYGVSKGAVAWFRSYLSGRSQYVHLKESNSEILPIECGVPQGSILGPLLFLVYINDIACSVPKLNVILYADDTNLFFAHRKLDTAMSVLNEQLRFLEDWLNANRLSVNTKKTRYMIFGRENDTDSLPLALPSLYLNGKPIQRTFASKFLGVILDENLTWKSHIQVVESKISKNIGVIARARKNVNSKAARSLYFSFVHPYISYGNLAYASTHKSKLSRIHRLQKRAVRVISYAKNRCHSRPLMVEHKILNVYEINILNTLCFVYKHQRNKLPALFAPYLQRVKHRYESRLSKFGYVERPGIGKGRFRISTRGPYLWNRLKCNTAKESQTLASFKYEIKKFLLELPNPSSVW